MLRLGVGIIKLLNYCSLATWCISKDKKMDADTPPWIGNIKIQAKWLPEARIYKKGGKKEKKGEEKKKKNKTLQLL